MASGWTNRGKCNALAERFRGVAPPANFFLALVTAVNPPTADTNLLSDCTEIAIGNGYAAAGGVSVARNSTDFDVITEDDLNDRALVQLKDIIFTASSGNLPASGDGASYAVLLGPNATPANREVEAYWDLGGARVVSDTQTLTLQDCELRLSDA